MITFFRTKSLSLMTIILSIFVLAGTLEAECPCGCPCPEQCECGCTTGITCQCGTEEQLEQEDDEQQVDECEAAYVLPQAACCQNDYGYDPCGECDCDYFRPIIQNPFFSNDFCCRPNYLLTDIDIAKSCGRHGLWFPEDPPLVRPFIADPRQVAFSVAWRFNDRCMTKNTIPVSYGDTIIFYRWFDMGCIPGEFEINLEGCLWAIFDPCEFSAPLINADYYVSGVLAYAYKNWGAKMRFYHISSHIGDEWLLYHPNFDRRNPSAEYLDVFVTNQLTHDIRIYGGLGWVVEQDESFHFAHWYTEAGLELHLSELGFFSYCNQLYGEPIFGMHMRYNPKFKNHVDMTYILGYEFGKTSGLQRCTRFFIEYHDGYSPEGQFCRCHTNYFSINMTYGY